MLNFDDNENDKKNSRYKGWVKRQGKKRNR